MSLDETKRSDMDEATKQTGVTPAEADTAEAADTTLPAADIQEDDRFSAFDNPVRPEEKAPKKRRMNKRLRTLVIALVSVVVLVAILVLIPLLPEDIEDSSGSSSETDVSQDSVSYTILDKGIKTDESTDEAPITVTGATIRNDSGTYTFRYNEKEKVYLLAGYEDISLEESMVSTMTDCATTLTAQDKLATVSTLSDYGLDKPAITATFTYHDKSSATLLVGNQTPAEDGYYVKLKDGNDVYICSESMLSPFMMTAGEYVEAMLLAAPAVKEDDAEGYAVLRELTLSGKVFDQTIALRRTSHTDSEEFTYANYVMTKPYLRTVSENAATDLAAFISLTASRAVVLHPTAKQLAQYGFNDPQVVAQVKLAVETTAESETGSKVESGQDTIPSVFYNNVSTTITVGSTNELGDYYVMVKDVNAIFLVSSSSLSPIAERRYDNTVGELLFLKDITKLGVANITVGDTTHSFKLTHHPDEEEADDKLTVTLDGKTLSTPDFRVLYQLTMALNRYGAAQKAPSGKPVLSVAFTLNDGSKYLSADFYATSASVYTVKTSQGETFAIKASTVTNYINQVNRYVNGETVLEN